MFQVAKAYKSRCLVFMSQVKVTLSISGSSKYGRDRKDHSSHSGQFNLMICLNSANMDCTSLVGS